MPKSNRVTERKRPKTALATVASSNQSAPPSLPSNLAPFIGERPLLRGEDPDEYDAVFDKVAETVAPADAIEWIWAKDVVDSLWERRRAQIMRHQIVELNRFRALVSVIKTLQHTPPRDLMGKPTEGAERLVTSWLEGGRKGKDAMQDFLAQYGLDERVIATRTFLSRAAEFDQLDRMVAAADKRRDAVIREIERRRADRASRFREAADIVDAETADDEQAA